mmetsp:Transcript_105147/g.302319  ORF Transcript_105147/g.302319 Transcript_105147/m.302319 type:complete len:236 (-) Transcript_105147:101-808(-)
MALSLKPPSAATSITRSFAKRLAVCCTLPGFSRSPVPSAPQSARQRASLARSGYHWSFSSACQSPAAPASLRSVKPNPFMSWRCTRRCCDQAPGPPQRSRKDEPRGTPSNRPTARESSASLSPARFSCSLPPMSLCGNSCALASRLIKLRARGGGGMFQRSSRRPLAYQSCSTSSGLQVAPLSICCLSALSTPGLALRGSKVPVEELSVKRRQASSKGARTSRPSGSGIPASALK